MIGLYSELNLAWLYLIAACKPNGRFETNKKVCLSISGHHPESWRPSWSIRTALLAIIGFLPTHGNGAIGSLDYTPEERKKLALKDNTIKLVVSAVGPVTSLSFYV
ncbi:ubiquitin-conjugating enzyme E2 J1 [Trichonephila clavipes]|nr:ubiquitin-conjugating enzyme E2 J1 [Trichonephila clavipes]